MSSLYDYIIVGAGSAGCALAARFAWGRPKLRILVLEARRLRQPGRELAV